MKNFSEYTKNILKVMIWPVIFVISEFLILSLFSFVFMQNEKAIFKNITSFEVFSDYFGTDLYTKRLSNFIFNNQIWIVLISALIFLPIFLKLYKKIKSKKYKDNKIEIKNLAILFIIGGLFGILYNTVMFNLDKIFHFTNFYVSTNSKNIFILILCTGIIGPILEELLYRGIVYNKLKQKYSWPISCIITSIIFGIMHANMIQMVYACLLSFITIHFYEKYKSIYAPILVHIGANIFVNILMRYIIRINFYVGLIIIIVSLVILTIYFIKDIKKMYIKKK